MIWSYLRTKVRDSILAGVHDALTEIDGADTATGAAGGGNVLASLRAKLAPALPAPADMAFPTPTASSEASESVDGPAVTPSGRKAKAKG